MRQSSKPSEMRVWSFVRKGLLDFAGPPLSRPFVGIADRKTYLFNFMSK